MESRIDRRQLLLGAGAGSVAIAALAFPTLTAAAESDRESLEGAWLVEHQAPAPSHGIVIFANGGVLAGRDFNPGGPPEFGAWAKTEHHKFVATFYNGLGGPGTGPILKVILQGSWDGDVMSGTSTFEVLDASGNVLASGPDTFSGTRVTAGR